MNIIHTASCIWSYFSVVVNYVSLHYVSFDIKLIKRSHRSKMSQKSLKGLITLPVERYFNRTHKTECPNNKCTLIELPQDIRKTQPVLRVAVLCSTRPSGREIYCTTVVHNTWLVKRPTNLYYFHFSCKMKTNSTKLISAT